MDAIDKINILLSKKGISGAELERMVGVSNSVYSQWNTKTTKPSNKSLIKVAAALGVDVTEILPDKKEKPALQEENELTALQRQVLEQIKTASPAKLQAIIALLGDK